LSTEKPKIVLLIAVKPDFLPKPSQNYTRIDVVWKFNESEIIKK